MQETTFWTVPDLLIQEFPALRAEIEAEYYFWLDTVPNPYPHFFLEGFLLPLLTGASPITAPEDRKKAGAILDELLTSRDEDLAAAALTSVWEMLADNPDLRESASEFLGPTAQEWLTRLGGK
jgi:hypothetical protein